MSECTHQYDQLVWIDKKYSVFTKCTNCNEIFQPTVNYRMPIPANYKPVLNVIVSCIRTNHAN